MYFINAMLLKLTIHINTFGIVYKHWPDTCEFITQTIMNSEIDVWDLSCYCNRVYNTRPVYTHVTPIL